jgi:HAMP domain-containing protein
VSAWLTWWFILGGVVLVAFLAFLIALVRHLLVLWRTVRRMQDELAPVMQDLSAQTTRAGERASSLKPPSRPSRAR